MVVPLVLTGSLANAIGRAKTAGGPALTPLVSLTRARARPWSARRYLRGRSPTRSVAPKPPGARFNLFCQPYAREGQAVVCPLLRGRSPTRSVAPKQPRGDTASAPTARVRTHPVFVCRGFQKTQTADFEKAVCIILDINLNDGSGIELRHRLNAMGILCLLSTLPGTTTLPFARLRSHPGASPILQSPSRRSR